MENLDTIKVKNLVIQAESKARQFKEDGLKTNQLRNFYSAITKIRQDYGVEKNYTKVESQLVMLKPKLAYAAGRQTAVKENFYPFIKAAIDGVLQAQNKPLALDHFLLLIESIVAYHKFFGDH